MVLLQSIRMYLIQSHQNQSTFQYGSTSIKMGIMSATLHRNLHSNMVLLQSRSSLAYFLASSNLHSNMVLLQWREERHHGTDKWFTFQYGSTSMKMRYSWLSLLNNLHSNMVLLQWKTYLQSQYSKEIYIPIWFYFNDEGATGEAEADDIYIPIWFYFNVSRVQKNRKLVRIYIPIWFYFNKFVLLQSLVPFQFTFQYGSTSILPALGVISPLLYLHSNMVLLQSNHSILSYHQ